MADPDYLELPLGDFLRRVAEAAPAPSAGAVAATTVALSAGLAAMSAGLSRSHLPDAQLLEARALELQDQVQWLAQRDAAAFGGVLSARALPRDDPERPAAVSAALSDASDVPLEIARLGAEVLDLAMAVARGGNPNLRGDALTACLLAQAGVRAATALVDLNLADEKDPKRKRAARLAAAAEGVQLSPAPWER